MAVECQVTLSCHMARAYGLGNDNWSTMTVDTSPTFASTNKGAARPDRRAQNRDRTRQALAEAAIELFATQGYGATTVEQIAILAEVSPRTFFRHFDSKEDVLLPFDEPMSAAAAIRSQPPSMSDMEALRAALVATAPTNEPAVARIRMLREALTSSAALRGRNFDQRNLGEHAMARALADRRQLDEPDPEARLAAVIGFAVLRTAMDRWLDLPDPTPLAPLIEAEFDRAHRLMSHDA
jgi:AcrR family transcriptional regulator